MGTAAFSAPVAEIRTPHRVLPLRRELSPRERQICEQIAQGRRNKEIAESLGISEQTVKYHASAVYRKLGMSTVAGPNVNVRARAMAMLYKNPGIVDVHLEEADWRKLTAMQQRICLDKIRGFTNPQIAARLEVSRDTVQFNYAVARQVLGVRDRLALALYIGKRNLDRYDTDKGE